MKKFLFAVFLLIAGFELMGCDQLPKLGLGTEGKLATASEDSCGFVQNSFGQRVSWKQSLPIKIYIDPTFPQEYVPVLKAAGARWEADLHRTLFVFEQATAASSPSWDGRNVVYWQNPWENSNRTLEGLTSLSWFRNQLAEADIKINSANYSYYIDKPDGASLHLESLLVHELGHLLGLKHLDASSVMLTTLDYGVKRDLPTEIDKAHLRCEYN